MTTMKYAILATALVFLGCTDEDSTVRTLQKAGFSEIQTTGFSVLSCGEDDTYATGFRAKNPRGEIVEGTVCCGFWVKACTIRF